MAFSNGDCQKDRPEDQFIQDRLVEWRRKDQMSVAHCVRCVVKRQMVDAEEVYECKRCSATKHSNQFSSWALRKWLPNGHAWDT